MGNTLVNRNAKHCHTHLCVVCANTRIHIICNQCMGCHKLETSVSMMPKYDIVYIFEFCIYAPALNDVNFHILWRKTVDFRSDFSAMSYAEFLFCLTGRSRKVYQRFIRKECIKYGRYAFSFKKEIAVNCIASVSLLNLCVCTILIGQIHNYFLLMS